MQKNLMCALSSILRALWHTSRINNTLGAYGCYFVPPLTRSMHNDARGPPELRVPHPRAQPVRTSQTNVCSVRVSSSAWRRPRCGGGFAVTASFTRDTSFAPVVADSRTLVQQNVPESTRPLWKDGRTSKQFRLTRSMCIADCSI